MIDENCSTVGGRNADVPTDLLKVRIVALNTTPESYAESVDFANNDPRCGCGTDGNGNTCFYDNATFLSEELARREQA